MSATTTLRGGILIFQNIRSTVFAAEEQTSNSGEGLFSRKLFAERPTRVFYYDEIVPLFFLLPALYIILFLFQTINLDGNLYRFHPYTLEWI